ncbi:MAG: HAMP domain-containing sensor histidine kinase [candidate division Zixibacteria bacterium]|nr:HAMP domain-containing sensor histidine kinase [candidate division Zixibacteria bacterium]
MKRFSASSTRNALIIFMILAGIFFAQMLWWIIFQVRNAESTRKYLTSTLEDERHWAIELLNQHYLSIYQEAEGVIENSGEMTAVPPKFSDPAVSGIIEEGAAEAINFNDSLYLTLESDGREHYLFLNKDYPRSLLTRNQKLEYAPPPPGRLSRPDWLTEEYIKINPAAYASIDRDRQRHIRMFVMEGSFFILLMLVGAYMIYIALRRTRQVREEQLLFVHSITHELKIPITAISLFLDTMKRRNYDHDLMADLAPKMKEDLGRLNRLIDNILQVRKLSDNQLELRLETIDLSSELTRFAGHIRERIESTGGKLNLNIAENVRIRGNLAELIKVWDSLIDNSFKYGPSGNLQLTINLKTHREQVEIQFIDNGHGIPEGMGDKLFEPFFRGNIESRKSVPGSGLGLYLAREFVRRSKGVISIKNAPSGGCLVNIRFRGAK